MLLRRFIFSVVAIAFGLGLSSPDAYAGSSEAGQYIQKIASAALGTISNKSLSKSQKQARLDTLFTSSVDIPWVARFVLGRYWREASDAQKAKYVAAYQSFLIKHYTARFTDYTSGSFTITGTKADSDNEFTVSMELKGNNKNDEPVLVDYRVRAAGGGFKIFDVVVEGISLISTQRSEFASVVGQHNLDYLITQLKNKSLPESAASSTASR